MLDEINYNPISRRIPCIYQESAISSQNSLEDNIPCLICAGRIRTVNDTFICPFTLHDTKKRFTVFRKAVNMNLITAEERFFDIGQRVKINACILLPYQHNSE